jgi:shikimate kinase
MPAAGKTSVGRILAHRLRRPLIDTDELIEARMGRTLAQLLAEQGREGFRKAEECVVLELQTRNAVISTGGSVVYSQPAMAHLSRYGVIVYLHVDLETLGRRGLDLRSRGVVCAPGQDLVGLLAERGPLYERFADLVVDARHDDPAFVAERIREQLYGFPQAS